MHMESALNCYETPINWGQLIGRKQLVPELRGTQESFGTFAGWFGTAAGTIIETRITITGHA